MRATSLLFFVLLISLSICNRLQAQTPLSGNYTIDASQSTAGRNFQTFSEAVNALYYGVSAAVTFDVTAASGPYNEQISISPVTGASTANTITFNCNGAILKFASTNSNMRPGVKLDGAHHIIFDNLNIQPSTTDDEFSYGWGVGLLRDADSNTIRNCTITLGVNHTHPQNNIGIILAPSDDYPNSNGLSNCDGNIITGNTVIGGYWGIILDNYAGNFSIPFTTVNDNQITNNTVKNSLNSGIFLQWCNNTLVEGNDISGQTIPNGIYLGETDYKSIVRNNRIHDFTPDPGGTTSPRTGIYIVDCGATAGNDNLIANNLIYGFNSTENYTGIYVDYVSSYIDIYHNTISFDNTSSSAGDISGIYVGGKTISNLNVANNIITIADGGGGTKYGFYLEYPGTNNLLRRNDYYLNAANGSVKTGYYNGNSYTTIADWQAATAQDFHSVAIDPVYTAPSTGNFLPTAQLLDNRGVYAGVDKDITGAVRNNTSPDLGAYEFLSAACSNPPTAGTTSILPGTTICVNNMLALDLTGNTGGSGLSCQWQTSSSATGTFANIGDPQASPALDSKATTTLYYRAQLTCNGGSPVYTTPIQVIVNPALPSGTYTIDAGQPTAGTNFHNFNDAILSMGCGIAGPVVFNVTPGSGPYNEQVILSHIVGSSAVNTITFNGNGETLSYKSTNTNQRAVIKLTGASHIIIDSLHIIAAGTSESTDYGIGVHILLNADSNTIRKCKIDVLATGTGNRFGGIVMNAADNTLTGSGTSACDSNTIANNTITGGYYGIVLSTSDPVLLNYRNTILNNTIKDFYQAGIYTTGVDSTLVSGNDLSRPARTNAGGLYGIEIAFGTTHFIVNGNKVHNLFGGNHALTTTVYGIYVSGSDGTASATNLISNNLVSDFSSGGTQYGLYNSGSDYSLFYHNTVSLDDSSSTVAKATYGFYQTSTATGLELKNNNFTIRRGSTSIGYAVDMSAAGTTFTADYNNYWLAPTGYIKTFYTNGTAYTTLSDWQAASAAQDVHSLSLSPAWKDPAAGDLRPTSPDFDNKGIPVGIKTDIDGATRSTQHPDIGAYEFGCPAIPVAKVDPDSVAICSGSPVTFTIDQPGPDTVYTWYDAATAGTALATGTSFTANNAAATTIWWVDAAAPGGCISASRTKVIAAVFDPFTTAPVVTVDSAGSDWIRFTWTPTPGATGYLVSRDGISFTAPSSGPAGLTHTITGLNPLDTASLIVKATGSTDCQDIVSNRAAGRTLNSQVFIPNTFTPNGDGRNDVFLVYSNVIRDMHLMIFNQWGNKVFESTSPQSGWNGTYNGKDSPVGVYVYTVRITLQDGTVVNKKGMINLLR